MRKPHAQQARRLPATSPQRHGAARRSLLRLTASWQCVYEQAFDKKPGSLPLVRDFRGASRKGRIDLKRQALVLGLEALGPSRAFEPEWWWDAQGFNELTQALALTLSASKVRNTIRRSGVQQLLKELGQERFELALAVPETYWHFAEVAKSPGECQGVAPAFLLMLSSMYRQNRGLARRLALLHMGHEGPSLLDRSLDVRTTSLLDALAAETLHA